MVTQMMQLSLPKQLETKQEKLWMKKEKTKIFQTVSLIQKTIANK